MVSLPIPDSASTVAFDDISYGGGPLFVCADAQTYGFDAAAFDMIISRFGVMFFDDPVRALANLGGVASGGAGLCCIAWRIPAEDPCMTVAVEPLLPGVSRRVPDGPGQFEFADRARVESIPAESGWCDIDMAPINVPCAFPAPALRPYLGRLGPVGRALQRAHERTWAKLIEPIRPAFDPCRQGTDGRFKAAC